LSQGSGLTRYRLKPLLSYQTYRLLSGWDFHPLVICAVGAHRRISLWPLRVNCAKHLGISLLVEILIPMNVVSDYDLVPVTRSDAV